MVENGFFDSQLKDPRGAAVGVQCRGTLPLEAGRGHPGPGVSEFQCLYTCGFSLTSFIATDTLFFFGNMCVLKETFESLPYGRRSVSCFLALVFPSTR